VTLTLKVTMNTAPTTRKILSTNLNMQLNISCKLDETSQEQSVSHLLLASVKMLLYGPNSQQQSDDNARQKTLTMTQLINYNNVKNILSVNKVLH
jgi:hypothetical protein